MALKLSVQLKKLQWKSISFGLIGFLILCVSLLDVVFPLPTAISYSQTVYASNGEILHVFLSRDDKWRMKVETKDISPLLKKAIIEKEDRWFYWHFGVNPASILRALVDNIAKGYTTSGASTISMQCARLLEPKGRTITNKLREVLRAIQLELHYNKDELLGLYLNLLPYGGNIEGVKSASMMYFGTEPEKLSLAQIMTLAVIPNKPTSLRIGGSYSAIIEQRNKWLMRFKSKNVFSQREIDDAIAEQTIITRRELPRIAPHLAYRLRSLHPNQVHITSTITSNIQKSIEALTLNYIRRVQLLGIHNCSAIVVDNATGNVISYVGSPDYNDNEHNGQVDGVKAVRSPGSALKPFVYAMAIDDGRITPKSVLLDVPVNYDGYAPENFDKKFNGKITAEDALIQSLNIPAVSLLQDYGVQKFAKNLSSMGFKAIDSKANNVGLSLILGGCGARLEELANAYRILATGGVVRTLKWVKGNNSSKLHTKSENRIISESASYMITDILMKLTRPDVPSSLMSSTSLPLLAWKTGTSYGRRDAWSIGYNKQYTVAVWVGNFTGEGIADLTGSAIATPLLFEIVHSLPKQKSSDWFRVPKHMDYRIVCAETGLPPSDNCSNSIMDSFIPLVSPSKICAHQQEVFTSVDEKISYCNECLPQVNFKKAVYPNYPARLLSYYLQERIACVVPPPHNPQCTRILKDQIPVITSPTNNKTYIVNRNDKEPMQLSSITAPDVKTVYWFHNDRKIASSAPLATVFFKPTLGLNKVSCSDDKGRNADITFTVEWE
jgi:penicillin-binding protein 1C